MLHHLGPTLAWVAKAIGHTVELSYGDMDYGFQVFIAGLILLGSDGAQALMWAPPRTEPGEQGECHSALPYPSVVSQAGVTGQSWNSGS